MSRAEPGGRRPRRTAIPESDTTASLGSEARRLLRRRGHAALASSLDGWPYTSLVATACDAAGSPLLRLSDLAQHTRNLRADPRVSLLFEAAAGSDPLAGARLTVLGRVACCDDDPLAAARFAARHPASAQYAGFADFHLYRVTVERGHFVAGFGRIAWIAAADLRVEGDASALAAAEAAIVEHMNRDHAAAVGHYAERLLGRPAGPWRMTGIDPEGIDLRHDGETARLDFAAPALTPAAARQRLVTLAQTARPAAPGE